MVTLELTDEQAFEAHQALLERQVRERVDIGKSRDAGIIAALHRALVANQAVAGSIAAQLGIGRDPLDEAKAAEERLGPHWSVGVATDADGVPLAFRSYQADGR